MAFQFEGMVQIPGYPFYKPMMPVYNHKHIDPTTVPCNGSHTFAGARARHLRQHRLRLTETSLSIATAPMEARGSAEQSKQVRQKLSAFHVMPGPSTESKHRPSTAAPAASRILCTRKSQDGIAHTTGITQSAGLQLDSFARKTKPGNETSALRSST